MGWNKILHELQIILRLTLISCSHVSVILVVRSSYSYDWKCLDDQLFIDLYWICKRFLIFTHIIDLFYVR